MINELSLLVNAGRVFAVSNFTGFNSLLAKLTWSLDYWWELAVSWKPSAGWGVLLYEVETKIGMSSRLTSSSFGQSTFSIGQKIRRDRPLSSH
jgi:hypothetical protein